MKYALFDYQRDAALGCLKQLARGRGDWQADRNLSSFALSAITGSGKTVVATAVIEAMIHGSADLGTEGDPRATFLWVTDDPALNRQTRNKMLAGSDLLQPARLHVLDNDFLGDALLPGSVYFLNVQKLSKNSGLAHGGRNLRQYSMWEVIRNTIYGGANDLYLVLDEAHRGVKPTADRTTIVQRIVSGESGSNPPMPVVWGISATIARFAEAMAGASDRTSYPSVEVDIERVRASGLVKDEIGLDEPDEKGGFGTTLLREAVRTALDYDRRWAAYAEEQDEPRVEPVLVVQVIDKATDEHLTEIVQVIESEWTGLGPQSIAHVFGEHERLHLGPRAVDWVQPESIQNDPQIRVVLAKTAISTGWDCPRAEVLFSERPAKDATHIAQVIGRMVRSPLTHRIATDDTLNSVACFLPRFDRAALETIKSELEGSGASGPEGRVGPSVLRAAKVFERNGLVAREAFDLIEALPSLPAPDAQASPLRRAKELARLLTDTANGAALLPDAGARFRAAINARLDGLAAEHTAAVARNVSDIERADILRTRISVLGGDVLRSTHQIDAAATDIERDCRKLIKSVKEGVGKDYWAHRADKAQNVDPEADPVDALVEVAALLLIPDVIPEVERTATAWVTTQLEVFNADIKNTTGAARDAYRRVMEYTVNPERVTIDLRSNLTAATRKGSGDALPMFRGHLYSDSKGNFPADLTSWEREVLDVELKRPTFEAWYRNPARPNPASLRIAYQDDAEKWRSLQVDFVIVSKRDDGSLAASIVDPHGDFLADTKAKLQALARYADRFGESFVRIESIAKAPSGALRVLDLHDVDVRKGVLTFDGAKVSSLYEGDLARDFR